METPYPSTDVTRSASTMIDVRLLDETESVIRVWRVPQQALMNRSGCFRSAIRETIPDLSRNSIDLQDDDLGYLEFFVVYIEKGDWRGALGSFETYTTNIRQMHDHALNMFLLADKYGARLLSHQCVNQVRKAVCNLYCQGVERVMPERQQKTLSRSEQEDFLEFHHKKVLGMFGGVYPPQLWSIFIPITGVCEWDWGHPHRNNIIRDVLLDTPRLGIFCMYHVDGCHLRELNELYSRCIEDGDTKFLLNSGWSSSDRGRNIQGPIKPNKASQA